MPTGPAHERIVNEVVNGEVVAQQTFPCRCMQGEDHLADGSSWGDEDDDAGEGWPTVPGAEEIWRSSGMDEDYDFRSLEDRYPDKIARSALLRGGQLDSPVQDWFWALSVSRTDRIAQDAPTTEVVAVSQ